MVYGPDGPLVDPVGSTAKEADNDDYLIDTRKPTIDANATDVESASTPVTVTYAFFRSRVL
jgi:hypothetical protein